MRTLVETLPDVASRLSFSVDAMIKNGAIVGLEVVDETKKCRATTASKLALPSELPSFK